MFIFIVLVCSILGGCSENPGNEDADAVMEDDTGTDGDNDGVEVTEDISIPLCSDPFSCTPERACDMFPVFLSFTDVNIPLMIEGSFSSPHATYGVEDDAFFSISWPTADNKVEWQHIPEGNHVFSIRYSCESDSLWMAETQLDDREMVITFAASCSETFDFNPTILAAPDCEFGPICAL